MAINKITSKVLKAVLFLTTLVPFDSSFGSSYPTEMDWIFEDFIYSTTGAPRFTSTRWTNRFPQLQNILPGRQGGLGPSSGGDDNPFAKGIGHITRSKNP
jgi:hypothetical protein